VWLLVRVALTLRNTCQLRYATAPYFRDKLHEHYQTHRTLANVVVNGTREVRFRVDFELGIGRIRREGCGGCDASLCKCGWNCCLHFPVKQMYASIVTTHFGISEETRYDRSSLRHDVMNHMRSKEPRCHFYMLEIANSRGGTLSATCSADPSTPSDAFQIWRSSYALRTSSSDS